MNARSHHPIVEGVRAAWNGKFTFSLCDLLDKCGPNLRVAWDRERASRGPLGMLGSQATAMAFPLSDLERGPIRSGTPPSENEVRGMGVFGLEMGRASRAAIMNDIGAALLIPTGGFGGQSRLFVKGDIRLVGLLALMARESAAKSIAANLSRAGTNTSTNVLLTLVTASREHASALTATSDRFIDSWDEGASTFSGRPRTSWACRRRSRASGRQSRSSRAPRRIAGCTRPTSRPAIRRSCTGRR